MAESKPIESLEEFHSIPLKDEIKEKGLCENAAALINAQAK